MLVIFSLALAVRLLHLWQLSHSPFASVLLGDARAYDLWAQQIAGGDWLGHSVFYQAPLYPYLLGTLYTIAGRSFTAVRVAQAVGGALACVCLAQAGSSLFSKRAGMLAGLLLAIYPPAVFFDGLIQKTSLDALLIAVMLWLACRLVDEPARRLTWTLLGLATGALALTRENALVFVPVILMWIATRRLLKASQRGFAALAFVAGVMVLLLPVAARNYAVGGGFYLTTSQFGPNFYIGNNADANGMYRPLRPGRGTAEFERLDAIDIAQRAVGRTMTPGEVSQYWSARARGFITGNPVAWGRLMLRKAALLINAVEVADTDSMESHAEWSLPLRAGARIGHFGVLLPLALLGFWTMRGRMKTAWLVPALAASYAVSVLSFYVFARYRYPLTPFVVLWAAAGLLALPALLRAPFSARYGRGALVAATLALAAAAHWPIVSHAAMQAVSENNMGVALHGDGRSSEALTHFRRAIALDSTDASAYVNLGTTLQATGQSGEALEAFAQAVAVRPDLGDARYFLGKALVEQRRQPEAIPHLRLAVEAMPESLEARTTLGLALASQDRLEEAIREFQEVVRRDAAFPSANWNLGTALAASGNVRAAIPYLDEAVRLDPANAGARGDLADARNRLGIALASGGYLVEAIAEFQAALRTDPSFEDARRNLATATRLQR